MKESAGRRGRIRHSPAAAPVVRESVTTVDANGASPGRVTDVAYSPVDRYAALFGTPVCASEPSRAAEQRVTILCLMGVFGIGGDMADCVLNSDVTTTVTAVSGDGYSSESDAKNAKLEALKPQIEQDRTAEGKTCSTRTCDGNKYCAVAFLLQAERDNHLSSYVDASGEVRWGYDVPAGTTYKTGCKCVSRATMQKDESEREARSNNPERR